MGSDDLFKKRKKGAAELKRKSKGLKPKPRILIVTEGEKTEPYYLRGLIHAERLRMGSVVVNGECGSAPMSVFKHAKKLFKKEERLGEKFDRVYCVFDKDGHPSYRDALDAIQRAAPKDTFHAISSVPCFEYWVLLHFCYSTKPYDAPAGMSSCEQLMKDHKKVFADYEKCDRGIYRKLEDKTHIAIKNARKSLVAAKRAETDNPTTRMHLLVEDLYSLRK